jgi:hypothetical protein
MLGAGGGGYANLSFIRTFLGFLHTVYEHRNLRPEHTVIKQPPPLSQNTA